ncbi:hypothetical protein GGH93_003284 [Coemansia aciculifera]|nr:hypothetical protein GGH93_003284 [Coemansia aciculifera]
MTHIATAVNSIVRVCYLKEDNNYDVNLLVSDGAITYTQVIDHARNTKNYSIDAFNIKVVSTTPGIVKTVPVDENQVLENCYVLVYPKSFFNNAGGMPSLDLHDNIATNSAVVVPGDIYKYSSGVFVNE